MSNNLTDQFLELLSTVGPNALMTEAESSSLHGEDLIQLTPDYHKLLADIRKRQGSDYLVDKYAVTYCVVFLGVITIIVVFAYFVPNWAFDGFCSSNDSSCTKEAGCEENTVNYGCEKVDSPSCRGGCFCRKYRCCKAAGSFYVVPADSPVTTTAANQHPGSAQPGGQFQGHHQQNSDAASGITRTTRLMVPNQAVDRQRALLHQQRRQKTSNHHHSAADEKPPATIIPMTSLNHPDTRGNHVQTHPPPKLSDSFPHNTVNTAYFQQVDPKRKSSLSAGSKSGSYAITQGPNKVNQKSVTERAPNHLTATRLNSTNKIQDFQKFQLNPTISTSQSSRSMTKELTLKPPPLSPVLRHHRSCVFTSSCSSSMTTSRSNQQTESSIQTIKHTLSSLSGPRESIRLSQSPSYTRAFNLIQEFDIARDRDEQKQRQLIQHHPNPDHSANEHHDQYEYDICKIRDPAVTDCHLHEPNGPKTTIDPRESPRLPLKPTTGDESRLSTESQINCESALLTAGPTMTCSLTETSSASHHIYGYPCESPNKQQVHDRHTSSAVYPPVNQKRPQEAMMKCAKSDLSLTAVHPPRTRSAIELQQPQPQKPGRSGGTKFAGASHVHIGSKFRVNPAISIKSDRYGGVEQKSESVASLAFTSHPPNSPQNQPEDPAPAHSNQPRRIFSRTDSAPAPTTIAHPELYEDDEHQYEVQNLINNQDQDQRHRNADQKCRSTHNPNIKGAAIGDEVDIDMMTQSTVTTNSQESSCYTHQQHHHYHHDVIQRHQRDRHDDDHHEIIERHQRDRRHHDYDVIQRHQRDRRHHHDHNDLMCGSRDSCDVMMPLVRSPTLSTGSEESVTVVPM